MKKLIDELWGIVLAKPLDFVVWRDGKLELKELENIPKKSRGAIARIERSTTGIKVVFHDKIKAAELLLEYDKRIPAEKNNLLEAIVESTNGFVDTSDIEELEEDYDNGISIAEGS